jgi:hypothetical protein
MSNTALKLEQVLREERVALARPAPPPGASDGKKTSSDTNNRADSGQTPTSESESGGKAENREPTAPEKQLKASGNIYLDLNRDNHWALCLSGGGIRSAAFALGVIQRFAAQPIAPKCPADEPGSVLQQFEYLSTVSGGGYIGSWLSAWLFQQRQAGANAVVAALNTRAKDHEEGAALRNLRRDSHYLAPSFSAISPDLWSDIAGVVRNLCLNWILLVPPMMFSVLVSKALAYIFIDALKVKDLSDWFVIMMAVATICFIVALSFSVANRPARGLINASQRQFLAWDLSVFLLAAALLVFVLRSPGGQATLTFVVRAVGLQAVGDEGQFSATIVLLRGTLLGLAIYLVSWFAASLWPKFLGPDRQPQLDDRKWHDAFDLIAWCVSGTVFGSLVAIGFLLLFYFYPHPEDKTITFEMAAVAAVLGVPWILSARVIAGVIFVASAEFMPGADAGLEYQARSGGLFALVQLGWLLWFGLVLWAPTVVQQIAGWNAAIAAVGGLSGAFSVIVGFGSKSTAVVQQAAGLRRHLTLNLLAAIAAAVFAIILVGALSILLGLALDAIDEGPINHSWPVISALCASFGAFVLISSFVISINRYSLHSIYRNRLVRAFLGASRDEGRRDKSKNHFTDFDSLDSPLLHQLWEHGVNPRGDKWKPLHLINAALNLVSSKNLAWQERMAAPFTFSALHCGSGSSIFSGGAYRVTHPAPTEDKPYGGRLGLTLGTAMAISGAAVSPNMGYNSSPGVAFLMALFNVRLGWWLPNPRAENPYYSLTSPRFALWPYFMEMFGLTSETEPWVYLSDGGHFENLGLYEMVRRRCRVIVVSDAGCDRDFTFADLGNALRKVWIDLGVRIDIKGLDRLKIRFKERPTPATQEPYWAVGRIRYSAADDGGEDGWLLYLKAGLHGTEPMDVISYAMAHPTFPHETTANQFFTESQFESYRMLGFEIAGRALEGGGSPPLCTVTVAPAPDLTLDAVIEKLEGQLSD